MNLNRFLLTLCLVLFLCAFVISCGDDDDDDSASSSDDDDDDVTDDDDATDDDDDLPFSVIMDEVLIRGADAPDNPALSVSTPEDFNHFMMYRWRQDTGDGPPRAVSAIVILYAGFAAGASDFNTFAHDLVEKSQGDVEAWVLDRRSNLLEDQTGLWAAEQAGDPRLAIDYYYNDKEIDGKTFDGFVGSFDPITDMMSEWGLNLHLSDIRAAIELIPEQSRQANVFLGGHSTGSRTAQQYAAYEFPDGHFGSDDLAGILLLDFEHTTKEMTEQEYLDLVDGIRTGEKSRCGVSGNAGDNLFNIVFIEIMAMVSSEGFGAPGDTTVGPDGFWPDWGWFSVIFPFMYRFHDVTLTNEARFGLLFDQDSTIPMNSFYGQMGGLTGGTLGEDGIGVFPNEDGATYSWANFDEVEPQERMDIQKLMNLVYGGPSDFTDWYYPQRLEVDDDAAGELETEGSWRHDYFKFYNSRVDVPVYALEGFTAAASGDYDEYREALGPVRGSDGASREEAGFEVMPLHDWGHIEVLLTEPDRNPFLDGFYEFVLDWSEGQVQVEKFQ